jgi:hypothetical protein
LADYIAFKWHIALSVPLHIFERSSGHTDVIRVS